MSEITPIGPDIALVKERISEGLSTKDLELLGRMKNIMNKPIGLRNEKGEKGSPLTIGDFQLVQNNFHCFFAKDDGGKLNIGRMYRESKTFRQCLSDHPAQLRKLVKELSGFQFQRWKVDKKKNQVVALADEPRSPEMYKELYDAYLLMRQYVEDDRTLFI